MLDNDLSHFVVNIEKELHIEQLMKEQNFRHGTKAELDEIINTADIQVSIEKLLEMI